jgi:beta-lactamase regulating signal transducer with metallopeptidase domain
MNTLINWLAQNALIVAAVVPVVWLACRLLGPRPADQHLLWSLLLVKLMLPPLVLGALPVRLFTDRTPAEWRAVESSLDHDAQVGSKRYLLPKEPNSAPAIAIDSPALPLPSQSLDALDIPHVAERPAPGAVAGLPPAELVRRGLFGVWLAGLLASAAVALGRIAAVRRLIRRAVPAPAELESAVAAATGRLRLARVAVRVVPRLASPVVVVWGRPLLLWPADRCSAATLAQFAPVLDHELAHVRRRDHWMAWLELAAGLVWWWNPVFWHIRRRVRETREMACDALALSGAADARRDYAHLLLEMTTGQSFALRPAPMFGAGPVSRACLQRRLAMLFDERVTPRLSAGGLAAAALVGALLLPAWTLADDPATLAEFPATVPAALSAAAQPPAVEASPAEPQPAPGAAPGQTELASPAAAEPATPPVPQPPAADPQPVPGAAGGTAPGFGAPDQGTEVPLGDGVSVLRLRWLEGGMLSIQVLREGKLLQELKAPIPVPAATPAHARARLRFRAMTGADGRTYYYAESDDHNQAVVAQAGPTPALIAAYDYPPVASSQPGLVVAPAQPAASADRELLRFECELAELTVAESATRLELAQEEARTKFGDNPDSAMRGQLKLLQLAVRKAEIELARCQARLAATTPAAAQPAAVPPGPASAPAVKRPQ